MDNSEVLLVLILAELKALNAEQNKTPGTTVMNNHFDDALMAVSSRRKDVEQALSGRRGSPSGS